MFLKYRPVTSRRCLYMVWMAFALCISLFLLLAVYCQQLPSITVDSIAHWIVLPANDSDLSEDRRFKYSLPSFVIIGTPKGGTTTLLRVLNQFKDFKGYPKELFFWSHCLPSDFSRINATLYRNNLTTILTNPQMTEWIATMQWDTNNLISTHPTRQCSHSDYRTTFAQLVSHNNGVTYEKTPGYFFNPIVATIFARQYSDTKAVVLLREPISRIWSAFHQFHNEIPFEEKVSGLVDTIMSPIAGMSIDLLVGNGTDKETRQLAYYIYIRQKMDYFLSLSIRNCYYYPLLVWITAYRQSHSLHNFKVIQSKQLFGNVSALANQLRCWIETGIDTQHSSVCDTLFTDIESAKMASATVLSYWEVIDTLDLSVMIDYFDTCNNALRSVFDTYPSLILGEWDWKLWDYSPIIANRSIEKKSYTELKKLQSKKRKAAKTEKSRKSAIAGRHNRKQRLKRKQSKP